MNQKDKPPAADSSHPRDWVDRHGDYLYTIAFSRLPDRSVAEDIVQETLLAALRGRAGFDGRSSERTWLTGILKRKIADYFRRAYRERETVAGEESETAEDRAFMASGPWKGHWCAELPVDWGQDPSSLVESAEFWDALDYCVKQLPHRLAAVFVLREIEQMETATVCKELDISATNLWVALHRARRKLRRCLEVNWIGITE